MIKLLIVDDSKINQMFAKDTIIAHKIDCEIELCGNGKDALSLIYDAPYDLILLDIIMPGLSGVEILQQLKDLPPNHMPKVIMLTNINNLNTIKTCFELGASDYIHKPFEDVEFTARVNSVIREIQSDNERLKNLKVIAEQNQALKEVNQSLKEAQYYLLQKEKLVAIGELAAGIAHEINNPLAFVMSNFEMLKTYIKDLTPVLLGAKSLVDASEVQHPVISQIRTLWQTQDIDFVMDDLQEIFSDSEKGLNRVAKIVQSMRNFARVSEDEVYEFVNLGEIIEETLLIVNNEIKYIAEIDKQIDEVPLIYCNKGQIEQVLVNILVNAAQAIKALDQQHLGKIRIAVRNGDVYCEIRIQDNGIGIDRAYLNRIFEPFFTTKPVGQGTGLGLSISYDIIVNKHNGLLEVTSKKGEGSEFVVKLPVPTNEMAEK